MDDQGTPPSRGPLANFGAYLSAEQCRRARALLGLSAPELSAMSGVSTESILRLEEADRTLSERVRNAVGRVLCQLGINLDGEHAVSMSVCGREAPDTAAVDVKFFARFSRFSQSNPTQGGSRSDDSLA